MRCREWPDYRLLNLGMAAMLAISVVFVFLLAGLGGRCSLLAATGRPCWFCGCTRDWLLMLRGQPPFYNPLSVFYAIVLGIEFSFRTAAAVWGWGGKWIQGADVAGHLGLGVVWVWLLIRCGMI